MYANTLKHIDSSADSTEVMKLVSHLFKTTVSFGWSEKNQECWKNQRQIDDKPNSTLGAANIPDEKNSFWILV